jgi:hypothetical protein
VKTGYTANIVNTTTPPNKNTCFNKFLTYHKYPLITTPQTLYSFLTYLQQISFDKPFKISANILTLETHIYLEPNDPNLPNHFTLSPEQYLIYYNQPIKSTQLHQYSASQSNYTVHNSPHNLNLNIATHNVRGFNSPTKREAWQNYCYSHNITLASITETKISNNTNLFFCNNNSFTYYWANSETSAEGTAIMIRNHLKPHIHSCYTHPGGAVAIDLFFKNNIKLRIISVYLSCTDTSRRNATQSTVINWLQQASQLQLQPIILGDFNTNDNSFSSSSKYKLINFLNYNNFYDIGLHFNNSHYT